MSLSSRRHAMKLYSDPNSQYSHRVRFVLAEKDIQAEVVDIPGDDEAFDDLIELNRTGSVPTLYDRDTVVSHSSVIVEYLDERYPHPPMFPIFPVARAECRITMLELQEHWCNLVDTLTLPGYRKSQRDKAITELRENVVAFAAGIRDKRFLMGNEISLVDCYAAPVLWRLDVLGVTLPERQTRGLRRYMTSMFEMDSFQESLSEEEREMRV